MAGHRPPPSGERPALQSVRRGRLRGWRLAALLIGAVAVALVYVGRFGLPDLEAPAGSPSASPPAVAVATPTRLDPDAADPPGPSSSASAAPPTAAPMPTPRPSPAGLRNRAADGIPARIADERVLRPGDARLARTAGQPVLVGGWYRDGRLYDEIGGDGGSVLRVRGVGEMHGPVVVRGSVAAAGEPLVADGVVWSGDLQTDSEPISVMPLLDALAVAYLERDPLGVDPVALELANIRLDCPAGWPRHSYAGTSGPVRLALVFSSPMERLVAEAAVTKSQYPGIDGGDDPACPHPVIRGGGRLRWIVDGNVMLLIRGGDYHARLARRALGEARQQSERPEQPWRPVTAWQALRGLWSFEPRLDVAPAAEEVFCVLGLPVQSWSIRHAQLRGMAIFDSTAEREQFQATTPATDVRLERGACSALAGQRPIDADARWVGKENVLLLVTGAAPIDDQLEQAIPDSPIRVFWP